VIKNILSALALSLIFSCTKQEKIKSDDISYQNFDKANYFLEKNAFDSAYFYYNKTVSYNRDSLLVGKSLFNMAVTQSIQGDYFGSNETAIKSIDYFKQADNSYLATVYNTIAINKNDLKQYDEAIEWYKKSIAINFNSKDSVMSQNNLAVALYKKRDYESAKNIYTKLLKNDTVLSNNNLFTKVIDNYAYTKWLQNPSYNAALEFIKALNIRIKEKDQWGQNASYAHLANYYAEKKPDSAFSYAKKMYQIATKLNSPDDRLEALQKLIKLSPTAATKQYFKEYQNIDDSLQTARSAAKNQFALIRYETEKSKADNLVLQKDNEGKRYQIIILAIGIVLLIIVGTLWYKKRKQRIELEAQSSIRDSKLKTSKKVHDVVANGLYRIMSKLDNQEALKNDPIINEIEELYEQSRDISYEKQKPDGQYFHEEISNLLKSFASENTKVILVGNSAIIWDKVTERAKYEIEHILQELMVNMAKHSHASDVVIRFEKQGNKISISYKDNGIGISGTPHFNNGLTNTGNRIEDIGGTITFDTNVEKGLKINISFPVF